MFVSFGYSLAEFSPQMVRLDNSMAVDWNTKENHRVIIIQKIKKKIDDKFALDHYRSYSEAGGAIGGFWYRGGPPFQCLFNKIKIIYFFLLRWNQKVKKVYILWSHVTVSGLARSTATMVFMMWWTRFFVIVSTTISWRYTSIMFSPLILWSTAWIIENKTNLHIRWKIKKFTDKLMRWIRGTSVIKTAQNCLLHFFQHKNIRNICCFDALQRLH